MSALVELTKPKKRGKQSPTEAQLQAKRDKAAERKRNQRHVIRPASMPLCRVSPAPSPSS